MIPSEINVDGLPWTVEVSDAMDENVWGQAQPAECRILLRAGLHSKQQEVTFWHEVIHTLFRARDLRLNPELDDLEEQVAQLLGPALCSFLWANANLEWHNG